MKIKHKIKLKIKRVKVKTKYIKKFLTEKGKKDKIKRSFNKSTQRRINRFRNCNYKFEYILNIILGSRIDIILLIILLMIKTNVFYLNIEAVDNIGFTNFITIQFILVMICPLLFIKRDRNRFYVMLFYEILFSVLLMVDNIYYDYSATMLSISQIIYIKYAEEIRSNTSLFG